VKATSLGRNFDSIYPSAGPRAIAALLHFACIKIEQVLRFRAPERVWNEHPKVTCGRYTLGAVSGFSFQIRLARAGAHDVRPGLQIRLWRALAAIHSAKLARFGPRRLDFGVFD
jgi:hypothetical protein